MKIEYSIAAVIALLLVFLLLGFAAAYIIQGAKEEGARFEKLEAACESKGLVALRSLGNEPYCGAGFRPKNG